MTYVIVEATADSKLGLQFYGGAREFWRYQGHEAMLSGPYETGKTIGVLTKYHTLLCKYPNSRALMVRKTYKSLVQSALVTYEKKVLPYPPEHPKCGIEKYGKEKPEYYDYPNGSRIVVGGLDNPDKILSAEYDYIYVNQAEELTLGDWETLVGRATGRAGNAPYPQVMGDCNPSVPTHWILHRQSLQRFEQLHKHNPTLYNQLTGKITPQGVRTMSILNTLTGVRKRRGVDNEWVASEGQVYDTYDPVVHLVKPFVIPAEWKRYRSIDFGFINPFVCQWWAEDHDGRLYLYREIYMTRRTVATHAVQINHLSEGERYEFTVADHDAEDRATLEANGISTLAADKAITVGIQDVQERLNPDQPGGARLFILDNALTEPDRELYREYPGDLHPVCTHHEFPSYIWAASVDGKPNKEVPVDLWNHGMDAMRYLVRGRSAPRWRSETW